MINSFISAEEFLEHIRHIYADSIKSIQSSTPNLEFQQAGKKVAEEFPEYAVAQAKMPPDLTRDNAHDHIARKLWKDLWEILSDEIKNSIPTAIAVGALDNMAVNAACIRSAEGFVAIVINTGLFTLFNKVSKLLVAATTPGSVRYCNRCTPEELTASLALEWYVEVCAHYKETGKPLGPQIQLDFSGSMRHAQQLNLWEIFVLCHEIGHVAAGHLNRQNIWLLIHISACLKGSTKETPTKWKRKQIF